MLPFFIANLFILNNQFKLSEAVLRQILERGILGDTERIVTTWWAGFLSRRTFCWPLQAKVRVGKFDCYTKCFKQRQTSTIFVRFAGKYSFRFSSTLFFFCSCFVSRRTIPRQCERGGIVFNFPVRIMRMANDDGGWWWRKPFWLSGTFVCFEPFRMRRCAAGAAFPIYADAKTLMLLANCLAYWMKCVCLCVCTFRGRNCISYMRLSITDKCYGTHIKWAVLSSVSAAAQPSYLNPIRK